jgi:BirA family biotin operon repressor/biotin-[acetyl-CoA-carboxylase] ligase
MTRFGSPHLHLRLTESTNDRARELIDAGAPSGTVVTADEQSAGRGRLGRVWSAPPRTALLYSAILTPVAYEHVLLPLAVPVAVCEAVEEAGDSRCAIKWPNDIWIEERKVAGVLIEARPPEWAVIGIGVNVAIADDEFPADLRWPATSIGDSASVGDVRDAVSEALGVWLDAPEDQLLSAYRSRDALAGRRISWDGAGDSAGRGTAAGIDDRGNLIVATEAGAAASLGSGEVTLRLEG